MINRYLTHTLLAVATLTLTFATGCARDPYFGMNAKDRAVAQSVDAIGGLDAYEAARIIKFDFVERYSGRETARRNHDWDRKTGDYSIQWRSAESGETYKVQFNPKHGYEEAVVLTTGGRVLRDDGPRLEIAKKAYGYFINDMHWLLAPYRLALTSRAEYRGRVVDPRGSVSERIDVSWPPESTPYKEYVVYVDPNSHMWEVWTIPLADGAEIIYTWEEWRKAGPVTLSLLHNQLNGEHSISIEKLRIDRGTETR